MIPIYANGGTKVCIWLSHQLLFTAFTLLSTADSVVFIQNLFLCHLPDFLLFFLSLHRTRSFSRQLSRCCRTAGQRSTSSACRFERPCRPRSSLRTTNVSINAFVFYLYYRSIYLSSYLSLCQLINTAYFMMRLVMDQFLLQNFTVHSLPVKHTHTHIVHYSPLTRSGQSLIDVPPSS